ncbi:perlucin-like [Littorina saxatilis]|uniref:C-type lectin domain-containing protein n=1 Tax=Littorina saxatilis TaxID=31220 RepID=A0AAN9ATJ7_9CAEN
MQLNRFDAHVHWLLMLTVTHRVFVSEAAQSTARCPRGFTRVDQSCYRHLAQGATWLEARGYCDAMGTELVSVVTSEDARRLQGYLRSFFSANVVTGTTSTLPPDVPIQPTRSPFSRHIWMLGSDHFEQGFFVWMNKHHDDVTYANWAPGQPMKSRVGQVTCMALDREQDLKWTTMPCMQHMDYVCIASLQDTNGPIVG